MKMYWLKKSSLILTVILLSIFISALYTKKAFCTESFDKLTAKLEKTVAEINEVQFEFEREMKMANCKTANEQKREKSAKNENTNKNKESCVKGACKISEARFDENGNMVYFWSSKSNNKNQNESTDNNNSLKKSLSIEKCVQIFEYYKNKLNKLTDKLNEIKDKLSTYNYDKMIALRKEYEADPMVFRKKYGDEAVYDVNKPNMKELREMVDRSIDEGNKLLKNQVNNTEVLEEDMKEVANRCIDGICEITKDVTNNTIDPVSTEVEDLDFKKPSTYTKLTKWIKKGWDVITGFWK